MPALGGILAGGSGGGRNETVTVAGDAPIAPVKRSTAMAMNPTDGTPNAPEHNITQAFTQGAGDASDPEVSYDGRNFVSATRCPPTKTSMIAAEKACTGRWNLWEYDVRAGGIKLVFGRNKGVIHALYKRAQREGPTLQGEVVLELKIAPSGGVVDCRIVSSDLKADEPERKLLVRIRQFDFGAKEVDQRGVSWPVDLLPS